MSESTLGTVFDSTLIAVGIVACVPAAVIMVAGISVGTAEIIQHAAQYGDTTLNLAVPGRGRPCSAYPRVVKELGRDLEAAQEVVNQTRTTDSVCYMGRTAKGAIWYTTGL